MAIKAKIYIHSYNVNMTQQTLHLTFFSTCVTFASQKAPRYFALTSMPLLKNAGSSAYNAHVGCMYKEYHSSSQPWKPSKKQANQTHLVSVSKLTSTAHLSSFAINAVKKVSLDNQVKMRTTFATMLTTH